MLVSKVNLEVFNENLVVSNKNIGSPIQIWESPMKKLGSPIKIWGVSNENVEGSIENFEVSHENLGSPIKIFGASIIIWGS